MSQVKHFLSLLDLSADELLALLSRAAELKKLQHQGIEHTTLKNQVLAMVFEKSSTRTRVSFETGMNQLGGSALFLSPRDTQLGRGEPVPDTARVLSSMVDIIMVRTFEHEKILHFAEYSSVPVINGLTDLEHPCQLLADLQTWFEHRDTIQGARITYIGDGNNMCHSWIHAAQLLDFKLNIACPEDYDPDVAIMKAAGSNAEIIRDPQAAAKNADLLVTDVWASMGQEDEQNERSKIFEPYQVNRELMSVASKDALFMHCLPAHRGEEVTADVIDGTQSVVWSEAENRLHSQKALLEFLLLH
ncbi:MAG: ornithine carbamoyltransferase [Gammaproteobacteria bacterium]|nr:MAG: ornithine carbamoyltransferase [Gammaproteobacteria bacterium]